MTDFPVIQEDDRIAKSRVTATAILGVIITFIGLFVAYWLLPPNLRGPTGKPAPTAPAEIGIVEQRMFEGPGRGTDLNINQSDALHHYSWVDRDKGVARIPIDRAIDLLVEHAGQ